MKKKIISLFLVVCMVVACVLTITPSVSAVEQVATLQISNVTAAVGDTVEVYLNIGDHSSTRIDGIIFYLETTDEAERYVALTNIEPVTPTDWSVFAWSSEYNYGRCAMTVAPGVYPDGHTAEDTILKYTFTVKESCANPIVIKPYVVEFAEDLTKRAYPTKADSEAAFPITAGSITIDGSVPAPSTEFDSDSLADPDDPILYYTGTDTTVSVPLVSGFEEIYLDTNLTSDNGFETLYFPVGITTADEFYAWEGSAYFLGNTELPTKSFGYKNAKTATKKTAYNVILHGWTDSLVSDYVDSIAAQNELNDDGENYVRFVPLEEFKVNGYQRSTSADNAFRFVARMRYAEYYSAAGFNITAIGTDDAGNTINKSLSRSVSAVFKSITGTNAGNTYDALTTGAGYYLSALAIKNLPVFTGTGSITFTITPYVINPLDSTVDLAATTLIYDATGIHQ